MGHEVRILCQAETRRLLWLIGVMFAVVLAFQYFELPYSNVLSSLFSSGTVAALGKVPAPSSAKSEMANFTPYNGLNTSDMQTVHRSDNRTESPEVKEKDSGLRNHTVSETKGISGEILGGANKNKTQGNSTNSDDGLSPLNVSVGNTSSLGHLQEENDTLTSQSSGDLNGDLAPSLPALPPMISSPKITSPTISDAHLMAPAVSNESSSASPEVKDASHTLDGREECGTLHSGFTAEVLSISEMKDLMLQSHASSCAMRPRLSSAAEQELINAKSLIENAPFLENDIEVYAPLFRNVSTFKRSYELMEQTLRVYIYREGEKPVFHSPFLRGIYASEGWFMKLMEANKQFVTKNPKEAHLFYLPFSSRMLEETLYVRSSHSFTNLIQYLKDYLEVIVAKYPYWNRTGGSDHFLVGCHDWTPAVTKQHMAQCIKAVCNADIKEGFNFSKDISLPETLVHDPKHPLRYLGGKPPSQRKTLAFFAGKMHGSLRAVLLKYWENKDTDMKILGRMPRVKGNANYIQNMKSSKYCICAKGYEVNSPRVVEAIFYECVPVIISDNFVPPLFEVLNWESFAVFVAEKDIPNLKNILLSIPQKRYLEMQLRIKKLQQHFLWHAKPEKYDLFHMILHSIWYKRVFQSGPR